MDALNLCFPSIGYDVLSIGTRVQVVGLRRDREYNGSHGHVMALTPRGYSVQMEGREHLIDARPSNVTKAVAPLNEGLVLLHSLTTRPSLNGQSAYARGCDGPARVWVETQTDETISVPSKCTLPLPAQSGEGQALANTCCICLRSPVPMCMAVPCGHLRVCVDCACSFANGAPCPLCRRPTERYVRAYA